MKFTPHNLTVYSPVGCDPFIKDNTLRITSVRTDKLSKTFFHLSRSAPATLPGPGGGP